MTPFRTPDEQVKRDFMKKLKPVSVEAYVAYDWLEDLIKDNYEGMIIWSKRKDVPDDVKVKITIEPLND
jgi:hypothetical protein